MREMATDIMATSTAKLTHPIRLLTRFRSAQLRVRFTSPHPKDFPSQLLQLISERNNICSHLHMPGQSGSTTVLDRMRRGYSREAYLQLIEDVRSVIPDVGISTDMIAGFCGETDDEHRDSVWRPWATIKPSCSRIRCARKRTLTESLMTTFQRM